MRVPVEVRSAGFCVFWVSPSCRRRFRAKVGWRWRCPPVVTLVRSGDLAPPWESANGTHSSSPASIAGTAPLPLSRKIDLQKTH
jgi:hypothetical protein